MKNEAHLNCNEVFPVDGTYPEITYVDVDVNLTRKIRDVIVHNRVALIRGPSKSGKTLLITHIMRYLDGRRIWIRGGMLTSPQSLWHILSYEIAKWGLGEFDPDVEQHDIAYVLSKEKCALIVDDFHYIQPAVARQQTCTYLKTLNEYDIPIIIIGVESPQLRDISKSDLRARILSITLGAWSEEQLKLIGSKGFNRGKRSLLNLELLADESFTSPFLMQLLCKTYCEYKENGKQIGSVEKVEATEVESILPIAAEYISYMEIYTVLTSITSCVEGRLFLRHDEKWGNFNQMILYAIAANYPIGAWTQLEIHVGRLWQRLRQVLHPSEHAALFQTYALRELAENNSVSTAEGHKQVIDQTQQVGLLDASIASMINAYETYYNQEVRQENIRHDRAIDVVGQLFCIRDPFLLFYLRNSAEVEAQFESRN
jgi:hypothetical protein